MNSIETAQRSQSAGDSGRAESFIRKYYDELKKMAGAMLAKRTADRYWTYARAWLSDKIKRI